MKNIPVTPSHTLIALCGTSPAVITETIWALALEAKAEDDPAKIPDRVIVLTTTIGKSSIVSELLNSPDGEQSTWLDLKQKIEELGCNVDKKLRFGDASEFIRVFSTDCLQSGLARDLDDLRTAKDQEAAADFMLETLRSVTETPDQQLTLSLAGGRKSMSALLYGVMTLVGREDDRITHVLVSPPYDIPALRPKFFFPSQKHAVLSLPDNTTVKASNALIELADIPFVPLRYAFEKHFQTSPPSFRGLAASYTSQSILHKAPPTLSINTQQGSARLGNSPIPLSPSEFILFYFLVRRAYDRAPAYPDYKSALDDLEIFSATQADSSRFPASQHWRKKLLSPLSDAESLTKKLSALRRKLNKDSNFSALIDSFPTKGNFSLGYPFDKIEIEE